MVGQGAFRGTRLEFLVEQQPLYAHAVRNGMGADCMADIQRRFFKRYPVELDPNVEPSEESLKAVDDNGPDPEAAAPDEDKLSPEEYALAMVAFEARADLIVTRCQQIRSWMVYRHGKEHASSASLDKNPLTPFLHKLNGAPSSKPRKPIPYNLWAKTSAVEIDAELKRRAKRAAANLDARVNGSDEEEAASGEDIGSKKTKNSRADMLRLRGIVTRDLFTKLSPELQLEWKAQADVEHTQALAAWSVLTSGAPSTAPADRQRCIEGIVGSSQPFLDLICAHTGMKASLIVGGPEPADGRRLNIVGVHSGSIKGPVKSRFGQSERAGYKEHIIPLYSAFLKKCYTKEECRSRALSTAAPTLASRLLDDDEVDASATVHRATDEWPPDLPPVFPVASTPAGHLEPSAAPLQAARLHGTPHQPPTPASQLSPAPMPPSDSTPPRDSSLLSQTSPSTAPFRAMPTTPSNPAPTPIAQARGSPLPSQASLRSTTPPAAMAVHSTLPSQIGAGLLDPTTPPRILLGALDGTPLPLQATKGPSPLAPPTATAQPPPAHPLSPPISQPPSPRLSPPPSPRQEPAPLPPAELRQVPHAPGFAPATPPRPKATAAKKRGGKGRKGDEVVEEAHPLPAESQERSKGKAKKKRTADAEDNGQNPKRQKRAQIDEIPQPGLPPNAPAWLISASCMFRSEALGSEWLRLAGLWESFEAGEGFGSPAKLAAKGRPPCIGDWIQRARAPGYRPTISHPDQFAQAFTSWWASLQPEWRHGTPLTKIPGDYNVLRKPGVNGLLSAIAALFFWGTARGSSGDDGWHSAVEEVTWVIRQLVEGRSK